MAALIEYKAAKLGVFSVASSPLPPCGRGGGRERERGVGRERERERVVDRERGRAKGLN